MLDQNESFSCYKVDTLYKVTIDSSSYCIIETHCILSDIHEDTLLNKIVFTKSDTIYHNAKQTFKKNTKDSFVDPLSTFRWNLLLYNNDQQITGANISNKHVKNFVLSFWNN